MVPVSVNDIVNAVKGNLKIKGSDSIVSGVSTDSRTIRRGDLFIPLKGENFDGHDFIQDAINKGAAAVLSHKSFDHADKDVNVIIVKDTLSALHQIAAYYLKLFNVEIVAVTGSTGKTTTKDMVYSVLSKKYGTIKTEGNYNNEIGLPLTVFNINSSHRIAVLEMGMSGFGEIKRLVGIAPPKVGIITNIGVSHIEKLGSRENILKAKLELFTFFSEECTAILNGDDDLLRKASETAEYPVILYGCSNESDFKAYNIKSKGEAGIEYSIDLDGRTYNIVLNTPGLHNVYNSLAAIAAGMFYNIEPKDIIEGLQSYRGAEMRFRILHSDSGIRIIDDAYNASPDSVKAALNTLMDFEGKRKIAVLGDMLELGSYTEEGHRKTGKAAALSCLDYLVTVGQYGCYTADEAVKSGMSSDKVYSFPDNKNTIDWLKHMAESGDTILIKGSRGMKMEEIVAFLMGRSC